LKALDDFLVNRKTTDFDIYVGLSAGSVLAAPLAGGVSPAEMLRSLEGVSEEFSELRAKDFYGLNTAEFASKPLEVRARPARVLPGVVYDLARPDAEGAARRRGRRGARPPRADARQPARVRDADRRRGRCGARSFPSRSRYCRPVCSATRRSSAICAATSSARHEQRLPRSLRTRGIELYVVAMNLDTAERVVFGHDEDRAHHLRAVQASTALPGFYKPARIRASTTSTAACAARPTSTSPSSTARISSSATIPFRPFSNR
jgi:hypothetical protein